VRFEWDPAKEARNLGKHGVSFHEAATAFGDPMSITVFDPDHSVREDEFLLLGRTFSGRLVIVVHTDREDSLRVISARMATSHERKTYEGA